MENKRKMVLKQPTKKNPKYKLRKLSIGVVSFMCGYAIFFGAGSVVHADDWPSMIADRSDEGKPLKPGTSFFGGDDCGDSDEGEVLPTDAQTHQANNADATYSKNATPEEKKNIIIEAVRKTNPNAQSVSINNENSLPSEVGAPSNVEVTIHYQDNSTNTANVAVTVKEANGYFITIYNSNGGEFVLENGQKQDAMETRKERIALKGWNEPIINNIPVKSGYTFAFWERSSTYATGDPELYTVFGNDVSQSDFQKYYKGKLGANSSVTGISGITSFVTWKPDSDSMTYEYNAVWDKDYSITFNGNGGTNVPQKQTGRFGFLLIELTNCC